MDVLSLALPPAFGFAIGYVTNALAIRMLFRPYREVRFLGLRFHGMIPRRKADIAGTVSRTVVSELLKEESVALRIGGPEVRGAVRELVLDLSRRYLGAEYGTLRRALGPGRAAALEGALPRVLGEAARAAQEWASTPEGVRFAERAVGGLLDRRLSELLRGEEAAAARSAASKLAGLARAPDLEERVRPAVVRGLSALANAASPTGMLLPEGVREGIESALGQAVPLLLQRFEEALLSPGNVERLKAAVRGGIEAYLLETEGGLVKNLARQAALLGRNRIYREADEIVDANLHRLRELVHQRENRERVERGIREGLDRLLAKTPGELLASLPPETLAGLHDRLAAWVCSQLRRAEVAEAAERLFERELSVLFDTPLRELLAPRDQGEAALANWSRGLAGWAASGGLAALAEREGPALVEALLDAPVGRPSRLLPEGLLAELLDLALDHLMPVVSAQVPEILRIVDVRGLIEREILAFSPREVEEVILSVARRELRSITWWGGILGALVGGFQAALTLWRP